MSTDKRENVTFAERKEEFERQVQTAQTIAISGHIIRTGTALVPVSDSIPTLWNSIQKKR